MFTTSQISEQSDGDREQNRNVWETGRLVFKTSCGPHRKERQLTTRRALIVDTFRGCAKKGEGWLNKLRTTKLWRRVTHVIEDMKENTRPT